MTYNSKGLVPQNPSAGDAAPVLYTYKSEDDVSAVGYFNDAKDTLVVGDLIKVVTLDGSLIPTAVVDYAVTAIASGVVTVANLMTAGVNAPVAFLDLTDTPAAFTASDTVKVNAGADALEFVTV